MISKTALKTLSLAIAGLSLQACSPVAVSEFNGDSVTIQSPDRNFDDVQVQSEAVRLCQVKGRKAQYASSTQVYAPQYLGQTWNHLFVCV